MFTGLVAEMGRVAAVEMNPDGARLRVETALAASLAAGDSVAVAGVCLTTAGEIPDAFEADVMRATLDRTRLGALKPGDRVNLEAAVRVGDRLGGHVVQGHIDGVGEVVSVEPDGFASRLTIRLDPELRRYTVERGSITLDGVSLTVSALDSEGVEVSLIPETLERTTLGDLEPGASVNVEVDVIARYVERLVQGFEPNLQPGGS